MIEVGPVGVQSRIYNVPGVESGSDKPLDPMLKDQVFEKEGLFICTAMTVFGPMLVKTEEECQLLRKMSPHVVKIYEQIARDTEIEELPSALPYCLSGTMAGGLHTFLHVPEDNAEKPAPLVVFLHGGVGNYKFYFYHLVKLARTNGFIVACPTLAGGKWREDRGRAICKTLLDRITAEYRVDRDCIFLAGISDGARGAFSLAAGDERSIGSHRLRGLIAVAGTPPVNYPMQSMADLPTLLFLSTVDRYYPITQGRKAVQSLRSLGCDITDVEFENEDHFFLLRRSEEVFPAMFDWIRARCD